MAVDLSEIRRNLFEVELLERLNLKFNITADEYKSSHSVDGKVRGKIDPDNNAKRDRVNPPVSLLERLTSANGDRSLALASGYPQTDLFVALSRLPPLSQGDEAHQDNVTTQRFSVEGLPENGTVQLEGDWSATEIDQALQDDEIAYVEHEYDIVDFPSDQLPVVIRADLHRDARKYIENKLSVKDVTINRDIEELARRFEGQGVLSIEIEFPSDAPEAERAGGTGQLTINNFRLDMDSTFNDISFLADQKEAADYTYNPEKKRVEWRGRSITKGDTLRYDVLGPVKELLGLGDVSATFRGQIENHTLTGTMIRGLYDRTGTPFWTPDSSTNGNLSVSHQVRIRGKLQVDPAALAGDTREVTTGKVTVNDRPSEAFDRVETVCRREAMTILSIDPPAHPEPAPNRDGVFQITGSENEKGDDQPGQLEVKREYGDEGVVYAEIEVTGEFTSMTEQSEVSSFDESKDRLVRSDEGGLETRGKSDVEVRARSASSELNSDLISKIKEGLTGVGGGRRTRPNEPAFEEQANKTADAPELDSEPAERLEDSSESFDGGDDR